MKNTPTPWRLEDNINAIKLGHLPKNYSQLAIHSDPTNISCIASINRHEGMDEIDRANAKLIVQAVNEYEALCAVADAAKADGIVRGHTPAMENALATLAKIRGAK